MAASTPRDLLIVFGSVQRVMRTERLARERGLDVDTVPAPRSVSSQCGVVLEARSDEAGALSDALATLDLSPTAVYRNQLGTWTPSTLHSTTSIDAVKLTEGSAYGGCGAKLAKGLLHTVLCGLPRVDSDALIVGIESADDAGVVKLTDELAIIHTTDFFPPMVDDPYTFGRIAATNALSDVWAMGGTPLAAMNLVSYPLKQLGKETLKEVLRGGLETMAESGAVLAGGHTVEGAELLYGLAVTGTVHPDAIWRNGGAIPGDVLVLTKPLGTGLVTTAAKGGLARPDDVATAMRWMTTLNRDAAEALHTSAPHAVTDVTGFGLAGHAAEMAEASGCAIELDLAALPAMPGALDAAATGLVPVGAGKNRTSIAAVLEIADGADELRVDLALDPQTSGGLLAAVPADQADDLLRRLPAAAVVGRVVDGAAGTVRLQ
ncbi:MAG: selenide, water dikinase SelD [Thermoanaerobaculales bacterium]|jgi:selenide,water dikinase|nr:selenide, water dikinase SelD [Thermoanaerobaculales bacterium]